MKSVIINAQVINKNSINPGCVVMEDGIISAVFNTPSINLNSDYEIIDAQNQYVSPGFIDLHTHGAGGADYMDQTVPAIIQASKTHMEHGTTTLLPTTLTSTTEELFHTIDNFKTAKKTMQAGPHMLGLHLEGPYFSMNQRGAQDPRYIKNPDEAEYKSIIEYADGAIARWSVAPELPGALKMGDYLINHNILPSIGHSDAEYSEVFAAFQHGYSHITHLYSGMSTITRKGGFRHLGVIESAYALEDFTVEIIADGCHLPPELLHMIYRLKGADKTCLITDSMRCAGQNTTKSILGSLTNGQKVLVEDGVAKLPDRTAFASSIATADRLVRVMHKDAHVPLCDCITMMCKTPAMVLKIEDKKGSIEAGKDADLVLFDDNITIHQVIINGKTTYKKC